MEAEAKIGLDASGFVSGAQKIAEASQRMAGESGAASAKIGQSFLGIETASLKSARKISGNLRSIELAVLSGADAGQLLQLSLLKVGESFKLGFAGTVGLGLAAAGITKITAAVQESIKSLREATLAREGFISAPNAAPDLFAKQIETISAHKKELEKENNSFTTNFSETLIEGISKPFIKKRRTFQEQRDDETEKEQKELLRLSELQAQSQSKHNDLAELGSATGAKAVKVAELELEKREKIVALLFQANEKGFNAGPLIAQLEREYALKIKIAALDQENLETQQNLRSRKVENQPARLVSEEDRDTFKDARSVRDRQAELDAAQKELDDAKYAGVPVKEATLKVQEATNARDAAVADAAEMVKYLDAENAIKERGISLGEKAARIEELELERVKAVAAAKLTNVAGEEDAINRKFAAMKLAAQEGEATYNERVASRGRTLDIRAIDPADIAGADEKFSSVKSFREKDEALKSAQRNLARTIASPGSPDITEAVQADREAQQARDEELLSLSDKSEKLKKQTDIQSLQLNGQTTEASNAQALLSIEEAITQAHRDRNGAAEGYLTIQKNQITNAQALDAFIHPERARQETKAGYERARQQKRFDQTGGLLGVSKDMSGNLIGGTDPITNRYRAATSAEKAAALEASGNTGGFDDAFKKQKRGVAEENRPTLPTQPAAPPESPLVGSVNKLISSIYNLTQKILVA